METFKQFSESAFTPTKWERVTFRDNDGKNKTVILRIVSETDRFLTGVVVDKEDNELAPRGVDVLKRMIMKTADVLLKRTPLRMNKYGMLESPDKPIED